MPPQPLLTFYHTPTMGLTFHYSGKFDENASLTQFIEEVKDIAEVYHWKYHISIENFLNLIVMPKSSTGSCTESHFHHRNAKQYGYAFYPIEGSVVLITFSFTAGLKIQKKNNICTWCRQKRSLPEEKHIRKSSTC
jgi:hypothetical protein